MTWFLRIAAPLALMGLIAIGAYLIVTNQIYAGLGLLMLTAPLQWMGVIPDGAASQADGQAGGYDGEPPPLSVLIMIGLSALFFFLAISKV